MEVLFLEFVLAAISRNVAVADVCRGRGGASRAGATSPEAPKLQRYAPGSGRRNAGGTEERGDWGGAATAQGLLIVLPIDRGGGEGTGLIPVE